MNLPVADIAASAGGVETASAQREADRLLLARYVPASLLVDEALNILQFRGETSPYLEHASGPPSLNLRRVARTELIAELSAAVQEARETGAETRRDGLSVGGRDVGVAVIPLQRLDRERCYLIVFQDGSRPAAGWRAQQAPALLPESEKDRRLAQAEREVASMRDYLQSTNEELTTTNDELRSRNRELAALTDRQATTASLREHSRRKDEFLVMLAHELRNPLTPITHAIHLLQRNGADPASASLHDMIARQTSRLVHLVDELLDVARIGRGIIELKHERVDLTELVQQSIQASRPRLEQRQHTLSLSLPERAIYVDGDPVRLQQVMANLLENAANYTEPNGRIAVSLQRDGEDAVIRVRDNGIGIAPEMLDEIFELFAQVDHSLARSGGGLGLGLTVVRRVLDLHGGRIAAYSEGLGRGSEFVVRLPLAAVVTELQSVGDTVQTDMAALGQGRRILIVDDNKDSAESLALLARLWGHEVVVAADGPTALALVKTFQPEVALVDIGLPGMNGYEIARRLRADGWHDDLLLVAVTGYGRAEDRNDARAAGFDVHMTKPVAVDALQHLLATGGAKSR